MTAPIKAAGFPCKGYQSDLGTAAGKSVADWAAGGSYNFTTAGSAVHGGGSCQVALSYDKGASFKVIKSFIGGCPAVGKAFDFAVPSDAPTGDAMFAWTWQNNIGNREYYMNCAAVTITAAAGTSKAAAAPFSSRPDLFVVNLDNGCTTADNKDVVYPDPGPDVEGSTSAKGTVVGTCAAVKGVGGGSGSGSAPPASSQAGTGGTPATSPAPAPAPTTLATVVSSSQAATNTIPGGVFATTGAPVASSSSSADSNPTTQVAAPSGTAIASTVQAPAPVATAAPAPASPSSGTAGAMTGACTTEGMFNCIGGTSFQQCASGAWSVPMAVAAGTKCSPGQKASLDIGFAKRHRHIRKHLAKAY